VTVLSDFNRDQAFRYWISDHQGIYVRMQSEKKANDDIIESYIQMDPATFLAQVMDDYPDYFNSSIRMIGLSPVNIRNTPNLWENKIIQSFKAGKTEFL